MIVEINATWSTPELFPKFVLPFNVATPETLRVSKFAVAAFIVVAEAVVANSVVAVAFVAVRLVYAPVTPLMVPDAKMLRTEETADPISSLLLLKNRRLEIIEPSNDTEDCVFPRLTVLPPEEPMKTFPAPERMRWDELWIVRTPSFLLINPSP